MSSLNSLPVLKPKKVEPTEQPKTDKEMERLRKIRERIIRNRASANASRQKKKQYLELLEKKNKELTQQKEKADKENEKLKNENENLKLQIQYLSQTVNKMNDMLNEKQQSIENIQLQNNILLSNNIYASPLSETSNNFTSGINSPESLSNISLSSPVFNDSVLPYTSSPMITNLPININNNASTSTNTNTNTNIIDTNVNTIVNNIDALSPQSSVGEPAVLTNENSLQRTLFCQRTMQQVLKTIMLTTSLTTYLMVTLISVTPTSALRLQNNNNYRNLYQKKNYIQHVPISNQKSQLNLKVMNYPTNNYSNYWNNKFYLWKDKIS